MGTISKNFNYSEFEQSEKAEELGIVNVIPTARVRDSIQALVINVLQPLRTAWGAELVINSGYRCPELNEAVNGESTSQHMKGEAADVRCYNPLKLAKLAVKMGLPFDQMGLYNTFVHFSHKLGGPQRGEIFYDKKYEGERL
ncbi:MAG TPA: peptidase M15 [Candidatus Coprenecus merdipullorum]|nr:peptidase M15 [Candidatus Coprenecus merdipullorum]